MSHPVLEHERMVEDGRRATREDREAIVECFGGKDFLSFAGRVWLAEGHLAVNPYINVAALIVRARDEASAAVAQQCAESEQGRLADAAQARAEAFKLVESELRARGISRVFIGEHVVTSELRRDDTVERCPSPTLQMAVEGMGGAFCYLAPQFVDTVVVVSETAANELLQKVLQSPGLQAVHQLLWDDIDNPNVPEDYRATLRDLLRLLGGDESLVMDPPKEFAHV